jgi:hypothetical protein
MKIAADFALILNKIRLRAQQEDIKLYFDSGYRSLDEQLALHNCWLDPICREKRKIVYAPAAPGWSTHNYAEGIDWYCLPLYKYHRCNQIATEEGLRIGILFGDPYHWDNSYKYGFKPPYIGLKQALDNMAKDFSEAKLVEI